MLCRLQTHLKLLAFEDVAISSAGLAGAGRDACVETTGLELRLKQRVDLCSLFALVEQTLGVVALLCLLGGCVALILLLLNRRANTTPLSACCSSIH